MKISHLLTPRMLGSLATVILVAACSSSESPMDDGDNLGQPQISGAVTGLLGSGLRLSLSAELELGRGILVDVEMLDIAENGRFVFDQLVLDGGEYVVAVEDQPQDLDQECVVENGEGNFQIGVTNIEVLCPEPKRLFRFDDEISLETNVPLYTGEKTGGILDERFIFGEGPVIELGDVVGQETADLFLQIDNEFADGIVYSNLSGKTYWIAAETNNPEFPNYIFSNYTQLAILWKFRKVSPSTHFQLELSKINLLAYHDVHHAGSTGRLIAAAVFQVGAFTEDTMDAVPFYSASGSIQLRGNELQDPNNTSHENVWSLWDFTLPTADASIFSVDDFTYNRDAGVGGYGNQHVATATLTESKFVDIDLSSLSVGAEFYVVSSAAVHARNSYSEEGGSVAYLRDPAAFDPGDKPGGVSLVDIQGLVMLEVGDVDLDNFQFSGGAAATLCPASVTDNAVLEFSADSYQVGEASEVYDAINITRSGNDSGVVSASVRLTNGTATVDEDFEAGDMLVRFGDGSTEPRTLELPIIPDELDEGNETLTLTLESPGGCAEIGPRNTATVTIVDDDAPVSSIFYTVGGTVSGLAGSGLQLSNIGSNNLAITANGLFSFPRETADGISYVVQVASQPIDPGQNCIVSNGSGQMAGADVSNVQVTCTTLQFAPSGLDPTFGTAGQLTQAALNEALAVAVQSDGKILVLTNDTVARFDSNGDLDTSFGDAGKVIPNFFGVRDTLASIAVQSDGKILIAGTSEDGFNSPTELDWVIARFDVDGVLDAGFGSAGKVVTDLYGSDDTATDILIQADGAIVVTGSASIVDSNGFVDSNFAAVRYTDSGAIDTSFGSDGKVNTDIAGRSDMGQAASLQSDDGVVIVGRVANSGGADPDIGLIRYTSPGLLDTNFGSNGIVRVVTTDWDEASDVASQTDGSIVLAGFRLGSTLNDPDKLTVMRFDSNGSPDTGFGTAGRIDDPALTRGYALALQADGKVVVAGQRVVGQSPWNLGIVRLDALGALDPGFGIDGVLSIDFFGGNDQAKSVAIQPDGNIVAAGVALNGTQSTMAMVRVLP